MARALNQIASQFSHYTLIIFLTIIWLILFPVIFIVLFLPIYIWRLFIQLLKIIFRPDLASMVSPRSTAMAQDKYLKPNPKCNLIVLIAMEGELELVEFYNQYKVKVQSKSLDNNERRMKYPEFHQYYEKWMGFLFWKWETAFRAEDHFVYYNPASPNEPVFPEDLARIEMQLIQEPFPPGFSPWKVIIIPNFISKFNGGHEPKKQSLICFKIHHGLADGFSIINLLVQEVCLMPDNHYAKPNHVTKSIGRTILDYSFLIVKSPFEFIKQLIENYDQNEWRIPEEQMSETWYTTQTEPIQLGFIKEVKNLHGVCFTSVIVGAITGGIRNYLIKRGRPVPIQMSTLVPFPMPGFDHTTKLRNFFSFAFLKFPTGIDNSHERVVSIHKNILATKKSSTILTNFYEIPIVARLFPVMVKPLLYNRFSTSLLSNFPGPNDQCEFLGNKVTYMGFNAGLLIGNTGGRELESSDRLSSYTTSVCFALFNLKVDLQKIVDRLERSARRRYTMELVEIIIYVLPGVGFMMMSYNGQFTLRINGCQSIFPTKADLDDLLQLILEELKQMRLDSGHEV